MPLFPFSIRSCFRYLVFTAVAVATSGAQEVYPLKRLLIADTLEKAAAMPEAAAGSGPLAVEGVPVLESPEFTKIAQSFVGRPIDAKLLSDVGTAVLKFARDHDRLVTNVTILNEQMVAAGSLRLAVTPGRYSQLLFKGNQWFSRQLIEQKLGIKPGDEIRLSAIEEALNWVNTNPFRQVKAVINQLPDQPGKADLVVAVEDVRPLRFAAIYDNDGLPILGRSRYTGSVQFGNVWGLDHQLGYQFTTNDKPASYQGHSLSYTAPLPWRHFVDVSTSYVRLKPEFGLFNQLGETLGASARYRIPLGNGDRTADINLGLEFKETNNDLQFGGTNVSAVKTDTFLATFAYSGVVRDTKGAWLFGAGLNLSPGDVNSRNTDEAFQPGNRGNQFHTGRYGAKARYATATLNLQRLQELGKDWQVFSRFTGQWATTNLIGNEQFGIGGVNTVRGFDPNVMAGDEGYVLNTDLQLPTLKNKITYPSLANRLLETRPYVFVDVAKVGYVHSYPVMNIFGQQIGWDDSDLRTLASTGVGVRVTLPGRLSLNFDYGWRLCDVRDTAGEHGRGHIKVVLAY